MTLAAADSGDDHWTFKREGFWHPRVTVRVAGSEIDLATFRPGWAGTGTLELPPARQITWAAADLWRSRWTWQETDGRPLVHFERHRGWNEFEGAVEIEPAAAHLPEAPPLVSLGWYLLALLARDITTAAVVAATS